MKNIIYNNFVHSKYINSNVNTKLNKNFSSQYKKINKDLNSPKDMFHSLSKKFKFNFSLKELSRYKKFKTVVIIGMGGSILGSEAIYYFLKKKIKKNFIFLNDINEEKLYKIKNKKNFKNTLFIVVSKSGNTLETLSNLLVLKIIKKQTKNLILISEKKNNLLFSLSKKMQLHHIAHKSYIGGRFSVLSEVGMLPAYLMGVNIKLIRKDLLKHFSAKGKKFLKKSTIMLANLLKKNKFRNLIFLNYSPRLEKFLFWNQQLIAESLGKNKKGFLPLISTAPKDHHSLLQLYLDGPKDKIFYIFSSINNDNKKINTNNFDKKLNFLNNKNLNQIKNAQKNAFIQSLKKNKIPFREFKIKQFNEQTLGELFSYFMVETALIGKVLNINPFNQPAVEQVKINTKKILS